MQRMDVVTTPRAAGKSANSGTRRRAGATPRHAILPAIQTLIEPNAVVKIGIVTDRREARSAYGGPGTKTMAAVADGHGRRRAYWFTGSEQKSLTGNPVRLCVACDLVHEVSIDVVELEIECTGKGGALPVQFVGVR